MGAKRTNTRVVAVASHTTETADNDEELLETPYPVPFCIMTILAGANGPSSDFGGIGARRGKTTEKAHGRSESRTCIQMPVSKNLPGAERWHENYLLDIPTDTTR